VPAATAREIVTRLHTEMVKVLRLPEIRERLTAQGTDPVGNSTEEFGAFMKSETAKWAKVIKEADIRAE
jgi:tripartite-type tricarboxylate transporter receptor subunit TctC